MNKIKQIISYLFILIVMLGVTACEKDFDEINSKKNAIKVMEVPPLIQMTIGKVRDVYFSKEKKILNEYGHYYGYYHGAVREFVPSVDHDGIFEYYFGTTREIREAYRWVSKGMPYEHEHMEGCIKCVEAIVFMKLCDTYGNVPFTEAGYGKGELTPKYDDHKEIYRGVLKLLDEAEANFNVVMDEHEFDYDAVYHQKPEKWLRFINSFRLRIAMHLRMAEPAWGKEVLAKVDFDNLFKGTGDEFSNGHALGLNEEWKNVAPSFMLVDFMKKYNDPRLEHMAELNGDDEYVGYPNGVIDDSYLKPSTTPEEVVKYTKNKILAYSEVCFLMAEAHLYGYGVAQDLEKANKYYRAGIKTDLGAWGFRAIPVNDPDFNMDDQQFPELFRIDEYMEQEYASLDSNATTEENFEKIMTQKWVALFGNFCESFVEMRRTGYPKIPVRSGQNYSRDDTGGVLPSRLSYPASEFIYNTENVKQAVEAMGSNSITQKLFWDVD
ncbi:SusD/RagB family nutrient-binding outer membrane lipoprotein [Puteibacter caeruleilacunae]|nr:SusD/RagB family nutrient-binding outer membrane lipoprotein [Puteibacter caeruleilacunae]